MKRSFDTTSVSRRGIALAAILAALVGLILQVLAVPAQAADHKTRTIALLSSGTYTAATGYSTAFDVSAYSEGQVFVSVTAEADVSTLDVTIQVSPDNTTWYTHTTIGQITATGQTRQAISNFGNYVRIKYVIGGTSFALSITGVFKD